MIIFQDTKDKARMKKMKKIYAYLVFLLVSLPVFGDETETGCGTFSVLEIPFGARGSAMGGAFCGLVDDITAIWYNPAGLGQIVRSEAQFCHQEWFQGIRDEYGGVGVFTDYGVISGGFLYSGCSGIEGYDRSNMYKDSIMTSEYILALAYATKVRQNLYLGLSLEGLYQNLDPNKPQLLGDKGKAIATSLGVLWRTRVIGIGVSLQNIGTPVIYCYQSTEPLPKNIKCGLSILVTKNLVACADINVPQFGKTNYNVGTEYWINKNFFALRTGYSWGTLSPKYFSAIDGISAGFGVKFRDFGLDYAYTGYGELGLTHRININWTFGKLQAPKTGDIVVEVVDADTKKPLQAIIIISMTDREDTVLTSPVNGKIELKGIPVGEVRILAQKDFYTPSSDTILLELYEVAKVNLAIHYTGPEGVPSEKLVKDGICGRILVGKVTEKGKIEPLKDGIVTFDGPASGTVETDTEGWYKIPNVLPGDYTITVEAKKHDYFPSVVRDVKVEHEKATLLYCTLEKVKTLRLFFETDRAYIHPRDFEILDTLSGFMNKYKENTFEIQGHTDPRQPKKFRNNEELSQVRAQAVADYLIKKEIAKDRLTVKGCGAANPIAPNDTEEGMALNRRIEIIINPAP
ncbi:MAG: PorV/PorQ family protein [Candidatus Stahlbacteria bacterium]|nr:PorV/PorQ family protein [Candidatus Stahlbacteria bacterium]